MNLFISWSGQRSELVAKALHPWIKCVIQSIDPFFSPSDISGGSIWINKLNDKLASSNAGIICLTPENQHEPWIQFEAGALAKGLTENRVFVLLIGMESHQVSGPLSSFNHTACSKEGIEKMVFNLNELLGDKKLSTEIVSRVFTKNYPDLKDVIESTVQAKISSKKAPKREESDIQIEVLELLRGLSKRVSNIESSYKSKGNTPDMPIYTFSPKSNKTDSNWFSDSLNSLGDPIASYNEVLRRRFSNTSENDDDENSAPLVTS